MVIAVRRLFGADGLILLSWLTGTALLSPPLFGGVGCWVLGYLAPNLPSIASGAHSDSHQNSLFVIVAEDEHIRGTYSQLLAIIHTYY